MAGTLVKMPDILRAWPWQCHLQKHYDEAKAQNLAWCTGFGAFDAKSQDAFDRCHFAKLAMTSYRFADPAHCRKSTDLMQLFFAFDEYTDVADEAATREMAEIIMDGLRNPDKTRPVDECFLGGMARQLSPPSLTYT